MQESYRLVLNIRSLLCEPRGIPSAMAMQIACSIDFFGGSGKKKKKGRKRREPREREREESNLEKNLHRCLVFSKVARSPSYETRIGTVA